ALSRGLGDVYKRQILDLAAEAIGTSWASLVWTAVGEDSLTGAAGSYEVRILVGEPLATEADWSRASTFPVEIPAAPAGDTIRVAVEPLSAETRYGIAVRARDAAGQISLFVPGLLVTTEAAPPLAPPPVENLQVAEVHAKEVVLSWTHPLDAGDPAGPGSYEIAIARQPFDESGWDALEKHPSPPEPGEGGAEILVRWDGLSPLTDYWFSVRAVGLGGVHSAMSELAHATTDPLDLSPPEPPSSLRIVSIDGDRVELSWLPSPAPDVAGYQIYEESGAGWEALLDEPLPAEESSAVVVSLASSFAITAIDAAGNEGRPSEPALRAAEAFSLEGPLPHPVGD
ncbi:MAG: fibronectin type III domain-containing protein, partial [Candidatus Eisenbacteria bacterium]|nr:fibronectin type III domain-containing protein [Candidatus Eisenbacteria bacterium]